MIVLLNALYKGGCGKTTNNVLVSNLLAQRGYRVLFIDFDPQMSGTRFLSGRSIHDQEFEEKNIYNAILNEDLKKNIIPLHSNIDYIPGSENINLFEKLLTGKGYNQEQHYYLRWLLSPINDETLYDFVVMDMSPSKSMLNIAVMAAASHHIVSVQSEVLAMEMVESYINDIEVLQSYGIESSVLGVSIGMKDRTKMSKLVTKEIQSFFKETVFKTITKRKSRIQEYVACGFPKKNKRKLFNVKDSDALYLHNMLTDEILTRLKYPIRKGEKLNEK
jgi:chromosome partitioning protein